MNKIFALILLFALAPLAHADQQTPAGDRIIENPASNGALKLRVNVGGTKTDVLTLFGTNGYLNAGPAFSLAAPAGGGQHVYSGANAAVNSVGNLMVRTTNAQGINVGGQLTLGGEYNTSGNSNYAFGGIAGRKENATNGSVAGYLSFLSTTSGGALTERMRLDSTGVINLGTTTSTGTVGIIAASRPELDFYEGGTLRALFGIANATNDLINGSADNDLAIRTQGGKVRVSLDSGSTANLEVTSNGLVSKNTSGTTFRREYSIGTDSTPTETFPLLTFTCNSSGGSALAVTINATCARAGATIAGSWSNFAFCSNNAGTATFSQVAAVSRGNSGMTAPTTTWGTPSGGVATLALGVTDSAMACMLEISVSNRVNTDSFVWAF